MGLPPEPGLLRFTALLRSGLGTDAILLHGVRRTSQFYFRDIWEEALGDRYHRFCSGEAADGAVHGRVNRYVEAHELPKDRKYYLCGQATMCVEMRDLLIAKGIPFTNIVAEIYF